MKKRSKQEHEKSTSQSYDLYFSRTLRPCALPSCYKVCTSVHDFCLPSLLPHLLFSPPFSPLLPPLLSSPPSALLLSSLSFFMKISSWHVWHVAKSSCQCKRLPNTPLSSWKILRKILLMSGMLYPCTHSFSPPFALIFSSTISSAFLLLNSPRSLFSPPLFSSLPSSF